jgi:hypothetical protein
VGARRNSIGRKRRNASAGSRSGFHRGRLLRYGKGMDREDAKESPQRAKTSAEARRERLAAELRANLKRRKAQAKARRSTTPGGDAADERGAAESGDTREGR